MTKTDHITLPAARARTTAAAERSAVGVGVVGDDERGGELLAHVRDLSVTLAGRPLLAGVDLDVRPGEIVVILGRSGSGKTTLLHQLAGLGAPAAAARPTGSADSSAAGVARSGAGVDRTDARTDSTDARAARRRPTLDCVPAALMPQRDGLMDWASAADNAALPLRVAGTGRRAARAAASEALARVGLTGLERRPAGLLSGGERQRVALARTLLSGRRLLLLDEPLAAVDALTREELHELLLTHLRSDGRGAVLVTHDLAEAARLADRLLVLAGSPARLSPIDSLRGAPGAHLEARGGATLRGDVMAALAA